MRIGQTKVRISDRVHIVLISQEKEIYQSCRLFGLTFDRSIGNDGGGGEVEISNRRIKKVTRNGCENARGIKKGF